MSILLKTLRQNSLTCPDRIALVGDRESLSYGALDRNVAESAQGLNAQEIGALGLLADNGLSWALTDLSTLAAKIPLVPLPSFFSGKQILHVVRDAGLQVLLTDRPQHVQSLLQSANIRSSTVGEVFGLHLIRLQGVPAKELPAGTAKITYTSGTTGEPKGVCLSASQMETVAVSLRDATQARDTDRHLCVTPLPTLLENIAGVYTPLLAGACTCLLPLEQVGLEGACGLNVARMLQALRAYEVSSTILAPQMLHALVAAGESGASIPAALRFVAVGGAPLSPSLLQRAHRLGIPAFEGYGLSECASVVTLNAPGGNRPGSAGRPLPHVSVRCSDDGEILVSGSAFLGYLGQECPSQPWPTGDLGYLDAEGYLHLSGRRKSVFITSYGRNVTPEWAEHELTLHPAIAQAAVFGEAKPFNVAVIAVSPGSSRVDVSAAIERANQTLPDYARVKSWVPATAPFTPSNQQLTLNGRLKREGILAAYADVLEALYKKEVDVVL